MQPLLHMYEGNKSSDLKIENYKYKSTLFKNDFDPFFKVLFF